MRRVYFIGIGGISMSGLAKYELSKKSQVFGSDIKDNEEIRDLKQLGAQIFLEQKKENIQAHLPLDLVVYSSAITPGSPGSIELEEAKTQGIKILKRSQYIGDLTRQFKTLAVAGMHGKTTTTCMLGQVLKDLGENPLILLGGEYNGFNHKNIEIPDSKPKWLVLEACEYDESFLDFEFRGGVILNIEPEHLDYFTKGLPQIIETFKNFAFKTGKFLIVHDEPNIRSALEGIDKKIIFYSENELPKENLNLKIPGIYNELNALAVIKLIRELRLDEQKTRESLAGFLGVKRRQEYKGQFQNVPIFDDYAHHPTEIEATLKAMKEANPDRNIFLIFQPHQSTRTTLLFSDFVKSLALVDKLILVEVYNVAGREVIQTPKTSRDLCQALTNQNKQIFYAKDYNEAEKIVKDNLAENDLILTMGAGPINQLAEKLLNNN